MLEKPYVLQLFDIFATDYIRGFEHRQHFNLNYDVQKIGKMLITTKTVYFKRLIRLRCVSVSVFIIIDGQKNTLNSKKVL